MYFSLPAFLSLVNLSLTLAVNAASPDDSTTHTALKPPARYYLKTSVIGDGNADKNDLYVSTFHTGPPSPVLALYPIQKPSHRSLFISPTPSNPYSPSRTRPQRRHPPPFLHQQPRRLPQRHAPAIRFRHPRLLWHDYGIRRESRSRCVFIIAFLSLLPSIPFPFPRPEIRKECS